MWKSAELKHHQLFTFSTFFLVSFVMTFFDSATSSTNGGRGGGCLRWFSSNSHSSQTPNAYVFVYTGDMTKALLEAIGVNEQHRTDEHAETATKIVFRVELAFTPTSNNKHTRNNVDASASSSRVLLLRASTEKNLIDLLNDRAGDVFFTKFELRTKHLKKLPNKIYVGGVEIGLSSSTDAEMTLVEKRMWLSRSAPSKTNKKIPSYVAEQAFLNASVNVYLESVFLAKFWHTNEENNDDESRRKRFREIVENVADIELTLPDAHKTRLLSAKQSNPPRYAQHEKGGVYLHFDVGSVEQKTWPKYSELIGKKAYVDIRTKDGSKSEFSGEMYIILVQNEANTNGETLEVGLDIDPSNNPLDASKYEKCRWCTRF